MATPFKKLDCQRRNYLKLPGNALKIWLYYYSREGKERLAWASEKEICETCDLNRKTMQVNRRWLIDNGWLIKMGERNSKTGQFSIPIYRVDEGTIPAETDGRSANRVPQIGLRSPSPTIRTQPQPTTLPTVPAQKLGEEVYPYKQVEPKEQVSKLASESVSLSLRSSTREGWKSSSSNGRGTDPQPHTVDLSQYDEEV